MHLLHLPRHHAPSDSHNNSVWEAIATRRYGAAFWAAAAQRPAASARRLGCRRLELLRMLHWERRYERVYRREWDWLTVAPLLWRWRDGREELRHVLPHMMLPVAVRTSGAGAELR